MAEYPPKKVYTNTYDKLEEKRLTDTRLRIKKKKTKKKEKKTKKQQTKFVSKPR